MIWHYILMKNVMLLKWSWRFNVFQYFNQCFTHWPLYNTIHQSNIFDITWAHGEPQLITYEPKHDKTNKMTWAPSEDSDQPGHLPSLIRVFAVRMKKHLVLSYPVSAQWKLWSDWADVQADLSLCWVHGHLVFLCGGSYITQFHLQSIHLCMDKTGFG